MSKSMVIVDTPCTCLECYFLSDIEDLPTRDGLYRKIARCLLCKDENDDYIWHDASWFSDNKEPTCPLMTYEEIDLVGDEAYEVRLIKASGENILTVTRSKEIADHIVDNFLETGDRADIYAYNDVDVTVMFNDKKRDDACDDGKTT